MLLPVRGEGCVSMCLGTLGGGGMDPAPAAPPPPEPPSSRGPRGPRTPPLGAGGPLEGMNPGTADEGVSFPHRLSDKITVPSPCDQTNNGQWRDVIDNGYVNRTKKNQNACPKNHMRGRPTKMEGELRDKTLWNSRQPLSLMLACSPSPTTTTASGHLIGGGGC